MTIWYMSYNKHDFKLEEVRFRINKRTKSFRGSMVKQAAWRGGRCSIPGSVKGNVECDFEQHVVVEESLITAEVGLDDL